jgi:hypothetical protein
VKPTAPVQLLGVAVEEKETARGAVPEVGDAEAVQASVQGGAVTVTVPDSAQVTPWMVAVKVQA